MSTLHWITVPLALSAYLLAPFGSVASVQDTAQSRCINATHRGFVGTSTAIDRRVRACMRHLHAGASLDAFAACVLEGHDSVLETKRAKAAKACKAVLDFEPKDPHTALGAAATESSRLIDAIFGPEPALAMLAGRGDRRAARCQIATTRAAQRCRKTIESEFAHCASAGLNDRSGTAGTLPGFDSASNLARCFKDTARITQNCGNSLRRIIDRACKTSSLQVLIPGCFSEDPDSLQACLQRNGRCAACRGLASADALDIACDEFDDGQLNSSCTEPGCDPLNAAECLLPYPSSFFQVAADSMTGLRLAVPPHGLPTVIGPALDPAPLNMLDGYSPATAILMHFSSEVSLERSNASRLLPPGCCGQPPGPPWIDTRSSGSRSLAPDSPTLLLDTVTGEPVLHFASLDARAAGNPNRQALILHPEIQLTPGRRYIVAVRGLRDPNAQPVAPEEYFRVLRDREPTTIPAVELRRSRMEEAIFDRLSALGIDRSELILAFDFVVRSKSQLTQRLLTMRDVGFNYLEDVEGDPSRVNFQVEEVLDHDCNAPGQVIWRELHGEFETPLFLDTPISNDGVQFLNTDSAGLPLQNGLTHARYSIALPCLALEPNSPPAVPFLVGHGLFDSGRIIVESIQPAVGPFFSQPGRRWNLIGGATDWRSFTGADLGWLATDVIGVGSNQLNNLPGVSDRASQSILNALILARMMKRGLFNRDPMFRTPTGNPIFPGPDHELLYFGFSLGGGFGTVVTALSPDFERAMFDMPATTFPCGFQRSLPFALFDPLLISIGIRDPIQTLLGINLIDELGIVSLAGSLAPYVTRDRLPGAGPAPSVLMRTAWLDKHVPDDCQFALARTLGLPNLEGSVVRELPGVPDLAGPLDSALVTVDSGSFDLFNPSHQSLIPPLENLPSNPICDPHITVGVFPSEASLLQMEEFLRPGGSIQNFCDGICDAATPIEISSVPCTPIN